MYTTHPVTLRRTLIAAAACACTLIAAGASAGDRELTVAIPATSQGLDLSRPADVREFYQRIKNAAYVACTRANQVGLAPVSDVDQCVENSLGEAVRRANKPALTLAYLETHTARIAAAHGIAVPTQVAAK